MNKHNVITMRNPEISRIREEKPNNNNNQDNKNKCNYNKNSNSKENDYYSGKIISKKCHKRRNLQGTIFHKNIKIRKLQKNIYRLFKCHVKYGQLRIKNDEPKR